MQEERYTDSSEPKRRKCIESVKFHATCVGVRSCRPQVSDDIWKQVLERKRNLMLVCSEGVQVTDLESGKVIGFISQNSAVAICENFHNIESWNVKICPTLKTVGNVTSIPLIIEADVVGDVDQRFRELIRMNEAEDFEYNNRKVSVFNDIVHNVVDVNGHLFCQESEIKPYYDAFDINSNTEGLSVELVRKSKRIIGDILNRKPNSWISTDTLNCLFMTNSSDLHGILQFLESMSYIITLPHILDLLSHYYNAAQHEKNAFSFCPISCFKDLLSNLSKAQLEGIVSLLKLKIKSSAPKSTLHQNLWDILLNQKTAFGSRLIQNSSIQKKLVTFLNPFHSNWIRLHPNFEFFMEKALRLYTLDFTSVERPKPELYGVGGKILQFHNYELSKSSPLFSSSEDFFEYLSLCEILRKVELASNQRDKISICESSFYVKENLSKIDMENFENHSPFSLKFTKLGVLVQVAHICAKSLEQFKEHNDAFCLYELLIGYCRSKSNIETWSAKRRGFWWDRIVLVKEKHLNEPLEAYELCLKALEDSEALKGEFIVSILCRANRLWNSKVKEGENPFIKYDEFFVKKSVPCLEKTIPDSSLLTLNCRPLNCQKGVKNQFYNSVNEICSVEDLVLEHFESEGWIGCHCEGSIWRTLFGLIFWDVIWNSNIPFVFQTKLQDAPLDFNTECFYSSRKCEIDNRLSMIKDGDEKILSDITKVYHSYFGVVCRGVHWDRWSLDAILTIYTCFGGSFLSAVFSLLAKDYRRYSKGMPDLVIWRPSTKEAKIVEVKGPNDTLSNAQKAWINHLQSQNVMHHFMLCKVNSSPIE